MLSQTLHVAVAVAVASAAAAVAVDAALLPASARKVCFWIFVVVVGFLCFIYFFISFWQTDKFIELFTVLKSRSQLVSAGSVIVESRQRSRRWRRGTHRLSPQSSSTYQFVGPCLCLLGPGPGPGPSLSAHHSRSCVNYFNSLSSLGMSRWHTDSLHT